MIEAFAEKISFADHELDDELITPALQAVLDLITEDPGHQVYYRSVQPGGRVWAETSSSHAFPHPPAVEIQHGPFTYQKLEIDTMTSGWQEWNPGE